MRDEVRQTRKVFMAALEAGYSIERATRIANGQDPLPVAIAQGQAGNPIPAAPPDLVAKIKAKAPAEDMAALRQRYTEVVGKKAFHGWDAETLHQKIQAALA